MTYQPETINTRAAWRPVLRPIASLVVFAQLALVMQPLSALAQDKGQVPFNPQAQAQMQRLGQWNQTIEQAKARKAREQRSPAEKASDKLARVEELVEDLKTDTHDRAGSGNRRAERLRELREHLDATQADVAEVRADFAATDAELKRKKVPAEILQRHQNAQAEFEQRAAQYSGIAAKLRTDQSAGPASRAQAAAEGEQSAVDELQKFFKQHPVKRKPTVHDPKKLPWSTPKPNLRAPAETKTAWYQHLYADQKIRLAQAGGSIGPLRFDIPPEPGQAPTTADLAETDEIQFTPAIRAKALELNNNPVAIYNWVRNNIEFTPTAGAIQSAQDTFDKKRGNAVDTASLLIALLRVANIPARYQFGTVDIDSQRVQNWVGGTTRPEAALQLLNQGGIAARGFIRGGQYASIRMEHAWVNAYVNWLPSRGNRNATATQHPNPNANLNAWTPLDGSFKQYSYTAGASLPIAVPLDTQALLDAAKQGATINEAQGWAQNMNQSAVQAQLAAYQNRVRAYIDSTPTGVSSTLADAEGKKVIPEQLHSMLEGRLPYPVLQQGGETSAVPGALQHKFTYRLYASDFDQADDNPLLTYTEKTSKLVGKRLTLGYVPASQADLDLVNSYLPRPHADGSAIQPSELPTSLPGYLIQLKAQLMLDGQMVAQASSALQMGTNLFGTGGFTELSDTNQWDLTNAESNVVGQATAIGISAGGMSPVQLAQLRQRIAAFQSAAQTGNTTTVANMGSERIIGDLLTANIWSWFNAADLNSQLAQSQAGMVENAGLSYGLFHVTVDPVYSWGVVRRVVFPGVNMDIPHVRNLTWSKDNSPQTWIVYNRMRGRDMSALEHEIPERFFNDTAQCRIEGGQTSNPALPLCPQGISAVKAIALAAQAGQKIYTITQQVYANNPNIVQTDLAAHSSNARARIQQALDTGYEVTVHQAPIVQDGWRGAGYLLINPETGAGGYLIDGGSNGGILWLLSFICTIAVIAMMFMGVALIPIAIVFVLGFMLGLASIAVSCWDDPDLGLRLLIQTLLAELSLIAAIFVGGLLAGLAVVEGAGAWKALTAALMRLGGGKVASLMGPCK
jgi:transglutaminase-like putative cysteine protease